MSVHDDDSEPSDFYVGYLEQAPPVLAGWMRGRVRWLMALTAAVGVVLALTQHDPGPGVFEFGVDRDLEGWLVAEPVPHLVVERPGDTGGAPPVSRYLLSVFGKRGAQALADHHGGRRVRLRGQLIHRDGRTMVEVDPASVETLDGPPLPALEREDLGRRTFRGEIVDSKCYWGVMKPGSEKPHRACAVRCISGGVPPVLLVRDAAGRATYLLLVDEGGGAVNGLLLPMVAEPVEVTGQLVRYGDLLALRANPATYRRLE